jgi:molecular chaperone GrpE
MSENPNSQTEQNAQDINETAADPAENSTEFFEAKLKEAEQKYVYLYADFENFKKRSIKERQDTVKFGLENVIGSLLEVLDNFNRALQFAKPDSDPNLLAGLKMVASQFMNTLEKQGVTEVVSMDQAFNPEFHEAVGQVPSEKPQGTIVQELTKGYTLHGRLLRPARVMVSSGIASN